MYFSYRSIYDETFEASEKTVVTVAAEAADEFKYYNADDVRDCYECSNKFSEYCFQYGVTYIFAIEPDVENRNEKYISIGFGEGASDDAKETRYHGVVVEGTLSDEEIKVYNGEERYAVVHEVNRFDDTLLCYYSVNEYYDYETGEMKLRETPVLVAAEISFSRVIASVEARIKRIGAYETGFAFISTSVIFIVLYLKISDPLKKISSRMKNFVVDREKDFEKLDVKGCDELAEMSKSFNDMADEIDSYIDYINKVNKERNMQEAELDIAKNIQAGLLKPPRYEDETVSINAYMKPAKNVGGDMYEYQVLDDGRVYIIIADVSGKGIIAALFMSRAITLLHRYALLGHSPSKMLFEFNNTLAEQNPKGLFITTFAAIYDPKTGLLTYSNAGHNRPYIVTDRLIMLDGAAGVAAGIFSNNEYEEETVRLNPGDTVFLYTDGVNEAECVSGELFGVAALEEVLEKHIGKAKGGITDDVIATVREYTDGALQNDDITVISMQVKQKPESRSLTTFAETKNLVDLKKMINDMPCLTVDSKAQLNLIAEEIFVNICYYAYEKNQGEITVELDVTNDSATLTFIDNGTPFDPTLDVVDINDYDHEKRIGGLGRFIVFEMADEYSYEYRDNKNILRITKNIN